MDQQSYDRELNLARANLASEVLRRAAYHLTSYKHPNDQEQEQVDHSDALAAEYAVEPHTHHWRDSGQRDETVMRAVDGSAGNVGGQSREGRPGDRPEAQLLALQVSQMLVER